MAEEQIERKSPRISINKLGEYLTGTPRSRRRVIERQKRPPGFLVSYYYPAQKAIVEFLESGATDDAYMLNAIHELEDSTPESEWEEHRIGGCIEALEIFYDTYDKVLDLEGKIVKRGTNSAPKLDVEGVSISIRPEILIFNEETDGEKTAGAVKLYFGKNSPLDEETGKYIATTIHQWVEEHLATDNAATPYNETGVLDVFNARMITSPRSYIRRRRDIRAACDEIKLMWPQI